MLHMGSLSSLSDSAEVLDVGKKEEKEEAGG